MMFIKAKVSGMNNIPLETFTYPQRLHYAIWYYRVMLGIELKTNEEAEVYFKENRITI